MTAASTLSMRKRRAACDKAGVCHRCPVGKARPVHRGGRCESHYVAELAAQRAASAIRRGEPGALEMVATAKALLAKADKPGPIAAKAASPLPPAPAAPTLPAWLSGDTSRLPRVAPPLRRPT